MPFTFRFNLPAITIITSVFEMHEFYNLIKKNQAYSFSRKGIDSIFNLITNVNDFEIFM